MTIIANEILTVNSLANYKAMSIASWNARSLWNKLDELDRILHDSKLDICLICESWFSNCHRDNELNIEGYSFQRSDRSGDESKSSGGGLMLYIRDGLDYIELNTFTRCNKDIECMWTKVKLKNNRPFYICSIYRPPSGNIDNFVEQLEECMTVVTEDQVCELVVLGDININTLSRNTLLYRKYNDFLMRNNLQQLIQLPTHFNSDDYANSCLDHILINRPDFYSFAGICPLSLSDHHLVFTIRKRLKVKNENLNVRARTYKNFNENRFVQDLNEHDWSPCLDATDVNVAWSSFRDDLLMITDRHAPYINMRFSSNLPPWMSRDCLSEIRLRDIKDAKYAKTRSIFDLAIARRQRNLVTNMKRNLKRAFYSDSIRDAKGDTKKLWRLLKTLFRNCDAKSKIQEIDGESDLLAIANKFNEFFTNIGPTLADAIPESVLNVDYSVRVDNLFEFTPVTVKEVYDILHDMSPSKATGGDNLPVKLLKYDLKLVSRLLVHIINLSLYTLSVPDQ